MPDKRESNWQSGSGCPPPPACAACSGCARSAPLNAEIAILAPQIEGRGVTVLTFVEVERSRANRIDALRKLFRKLPEVDHIYHVTGAADFVLVVRCASMEDYASFTEAHLYDAFIKGFQSTVVLRDYSPELP